LNASKTVGDLIPSEANQLPMPEPTAALDEIFNVVDERSAVAKLL